MFLKGVKAAEGRTFSYLGSEVSVTGDIVTEGDLHIDGKVSGDVSCGSLVQGPGGEVHGNIRAGEARLAGLVDGAVDAGTLTIEASARITGDIVYESVAVAAGAELDGRMRRRRCNSDKSALARAAESAEKAKPAASSVPTPLFGGGPAVEAAE
ncbi:MAG TPA: polymer-forming cytoskeletal protein [Allosphingosinicella sp.]|nr:polymer-forming cytoskeletal protein [Allosphingosinicella sp.]